MSKKTKKVCFQIHGDFITNFFRDLVLEGRWMDALNAVVADLHGMTHDTAIEILKGNKCLVGVNDLDLADEADDVREAYQKRLSWMFAGILKHDNQYYRPYAYVDTFGPDDVYDSRYSERMSSIRYSGSKQELGLTRAMHYMRDMQRDIAFQLHHKRFTESGSAVVLFERVELPPLWITPHKDAQEALDDFANGHPLEHDGWSIRYGSTNSVSLKRATPDAENLIDAKAADELDREAGETEDFDQRADLWRQADKLRQEVEDRRIEDMRVQIVEIADSLGEKGWMTIPIEHEDGSNTELRVPRLPFLKWARVFNVVQVVEDLPDYKPVSYSGMKMTNDDPFHTDWWIGAGLPLDEVYGTFTTKKNKPVVDAVYSEMFELQSKWLNFETTVLVGSGVVEGWVRQPEPNEAVPEGSIVVIPTASPDYTIAAQTACKNGMGAIITEVGGKLCHLATVGRELGFRVVRDDNAMRKYRPGDRVRVDLDRGKIEIIRV